MSYTRVRLSQLRSTPVQFNQIFSFLIKQFEINLSETKTAEHEDLVLLDLAKGIDHELLKLDPIFNENLWKRLIYHGLY